MKQIIVNVDDLTIDEKQRVNEALAKLVNVSKIERVTTDMAWFYAPSSLGIHVGWNSIYRSESPTHTPQQVLEMAGEVKQGHVYAELMAQYAEDAKTSKTPWELWEYLDKDDGWTTFRGSPGWYDTSVYRRKPKTHTVHGVEVPDLRVSPEYGDGYYLASTAAFDLTSRHTFGGFNNEILWVERGLTYQNTEEGKQAAILHAKAMLNIK